MRALAEQRPDDRTWQGAVETATVAEADGVRHFAFTTSDMRNVDVFVTCVSTVDAAIETANSEPNNRA